MRDLPDSQHPGPSINPPAQRTASALYRERLVVTAFILINSVTFFLIQYDRLRNYNQSYSGAVEAIVNGTYQAPEQYRIGLSYLVHYLALYAHIRANQSFPLLEFLAYALTLSLLYLLLRISARFTNAAPANRLVLLGFFLAAVQFPVLWIFPWERPETMPAAAYLAGIVLLVVRTGRIPFGVTCVLAVLASLGQALVRADVPVSAGVAILIAAAASVPLGRPRSAVAVLGLLCAATGAGTQLVLQHVVYPQASYPANVSWFQLTSNLNLLHPIFKLPMFLVALAPILVSLVWLRRYRLPLDSTDKLVLLICLVYLPVWLTMGLMVEVRIFVPCLFLAAPTVAKVWTALLLGDEAPGAEPPWSST